jgi:hypothetical protein
MGEEELVEATKHPTRCGLPPYLSSEITPNSRLNSRLQVATWPYLAELKA